MKNFKLRAYLGSPVILTRGFLTLDSLLAYTRLQETGDLDLAHSSIPLDRTAAIWHGSAAFFRNGTETTAAFGRSIKPDDQEYGRWMPFDGKYPLYIDQSRNAEKHQWRAMFDTYSALETSEATWYGRGDMDEVMRLMDTLFGVGKRVSHGYGRIEGLEIEEVEGDHSLMLTPSRPARPVPMDAWRGMGGAEEVNTGLVASVPPYFAGGGVLCAVPLSRIYSRNPLN